MAIKAGDTITGAGLREEFDNVSIGIINSVVGGTASDLLSAGYVFSTTLTSNIDAGNSTLYTEGLDVASDVYYSATVLDEFTGSNGSAPSGAIWTTAVSGSGVADIQSNELSLIGTDADGTASAYSSGFNYRSVSADSIILFKAKFQRGTSSAVKVQMTNGSTTVDISSPTSDGSYHFYRMLIDKSAQTATLYEDGVAIASSIDISSVTTIWYLKFLTDTTGGNASSILVAYIRHVYGAANSKLYQSSVKTASSTITWGMLYWCPSTILTKGGSSAFTVSMNNGANYESVTNGLQHEFTNTGTQMIVRMTLTEPSSVDVTVYDKPPYISSGKWGLRVLV